MGRLSDVASKIEDAKKHGLLTLTHLRLAQCPLEVLAPQSQLASSLVRLDLSFNLLTTLPDALGTLSALQVLYVNHNPRLARLPTTLAQCTKLQVLDASSTALSALPCEFARLERLKVLDIASTPLEQRWVDKNHLVLARDEGGDSDEDGDGGSIGSPTHKRRSNNSASSNENVTSPLTQCQQLLANLRHKDERARLKLQLFEKLRDEVYRVERSDTRSTTAIHAMLQRVLKHFPLADELRSLVRNTERLFPGSPFAISAMARVDAMAVRRAYEVLRSESERKKRAADLELKIRNLYFDRIDPTSVEGMVQSIYDHVRELADVKFLIKHAAQLFPPLAKDVDGHAIQQQLVALQLEIARERAAAVDKLLLAVKGVYSDTEPDQVQALVTKVAALFKVRLVVRRKSSRS